jgi:hypothetical protein
VKTCALSKGSAATRNHAEAMTIKEIQKLMQWSIKECLNEALTATMPAQNVETLLSYLEHALM